MLGREGTSGSHVCEEFFARSGHLYSGGALLGTRLSTTLDSFEFGAAGGRVYH